jgi:hypothetical protein
MDELKIMKTLEQKQNKIRRGLDAKTYRASNGVNASSFQYIDPDRDGCPEIWRAESAGQGEPRIETTAMAVGTALHSYVLEPSNFYNEYAVLTEEQKERLYAKAKKTGSKAKGFSRALSSFKSWDEEQKARGITVLTGQDMGLIQGLCDAALKCRQAKEFLDDPDFEAELSIFAELPDENGNLIECKGRIDAYRPGEIMDLKTTVNTSPLKIGKFIANYKTYIQAAFYLDLAKEAGIADDDTKFSWCFVQKQRPHMATYYTAPDNLIKLGRKQYREFLGQIHDGRLTGHWPHHSQEVDLPPYLLAKL